VGKLIYILIMKVKATTRIKHNGTMYEVGQEFDATKDETAKLLAARSIEPIKGVEPETPEEAIEDPATREAVSKKEAETETKKVASLPIKTNMSKEKLLGIARASGLEADKTLTPTEVYNLIKDYRIENNIVIDGDPKTIKEAASDDKSDKKEDKKTSKKEDK
jgi:hypothetical protein